jgi:peptidoglycan/xylan/chitin deacetylase (PgdA/CDA1 family)
VYDIPGKKPEIFRSACGVDPDELVEAIENIGCKPILWSWRQDTKDWTLPSVKSIVKTVTENIQDGDIILFHDYNKKGSPTPEALEIILPKLAEKGYSFITVSELLKIKRGEIKNETAA